MAEIEPSLFESADGILSDDELRVAIEALTLLIAGLCRDGRDATDANDLRRKLAVARRVRDLNQELIEELQARLLTESDARELAGQLRSLASYGQLKLSGAQVEQACEWADKLYPLPDGPWRPDRVCV